MPFNGILQHPSKAARGKEWDVGSKEGWLGNVRFSQLGFPDMRNDLFSFADLMYDSAKNERKSPLMIALYLKIRYNNYYIK